MSVYHSGDWRTRCHAYYRTENIDTFYYPNFWQIVGPEFSTEWEAFEYLQREFPGKMHGVQTVEWVADPVGWKVKNDSH